MRRQAEIPAVEVKRLDFTGFHAGMPPAISGALPGGGKLLELLAIDVGDRVAAFIAAGTDDDFHCIKLEIFDLTLLFGEVLHIRSTLRKNSVRGALVSVLADTDRYRRLGVVGNFEIPVGYERKSGAT
jgi:hypothetical protein